MSTSEPTTTRPHAWHAVISLWSAIAIGLSACGGGGETVTVAPPAAVVPAPAPVVPITPTPVPAPVPASVPVLPNSVSLFGGDLASPGNLDGAAGSARFVFPTAVYRLPTDDYMVVDNDLVRKVSKTGAVSTVTPFPATYTDTSGISTNGIYPRLGFDSEGNMLYGTGTSLVKITLSGSVTTRTLSFGNESTFTEISAIASDTLGNIWVMDQSTLRKISVNGTVTTIAGSKGVTGWKNGQGATASFTNASGLAPDSKGNIYVSDANAHTIRKVTPAGSVSTLAGVTQQAGHTDGDAAIARLTSPRYIFVDAADNLIVTGHVFAVRKITPEGRVSTIPLTPGPAGLVASNGKGGFVVPINGMKARLLEMDANGTMGTFSGPNAGGASTLNNVMSLAEGYLHPELLLSPVSGNLILIKSGTIHEEWSNNGIVSTRQINAPWSNSLLNLKTAIDSDGNIFILFLKENGLSFIITNYSNELWKITPSGIAVKIWTDDLNSDNKYYSYNFIDKIGIGIDALGNVLLTESSNSRLSKVIMIEKNTGKISETILKAPSSVGTLNIEIVTFDKKGNLYIAANYAIWVASTDGQIKLLAGQAGVPGSADGQGVQAQFGQTSNIQSSFGGMAVDAIGNVWVSDTLNHTVRKIDARGNVTTVAGTPGKFGNSVGGLPGTLFYPGSITVNSKGVVNVISGDAILNISPP